MMAPFAGLRAAIQAWAQAGDLPSALQYGFVVNALLCAAFVGPVLGAIGAMVITKRLAFFSQAIGHAALTGVALGFLLGEPITAPYVTLFGFCILFGLLLTFTRNRTNMSNDTLIGVFLSISMAVGSTLLVFVASRINIHIVDQVLFGSVLTVDDTDLLVLIVVALAVMAVGALRLNRMLLASFNPELAQARGVNVRLLDYVFVVMITLLTVASVKIIGAMLVEALLLIPAAAARVMSRNLRGFFLFSVLFSTISCFVGILAPIVWNLPLPSGGSIVMVAAMFFALAVAVRLARPGVA